MQNTSLVFVSRTSWNEVLCLVGGGHTALKLGLIAILIPGETTSQSGHPPR